MLARGITPAMVGKIVDSVSAELYGGNLYAAELRDGGTVTFASARFLLRVKGSRGEGSRTSAPTLWREGRHGPYACWHAHRDVLRKLFALYPNARVTSHGRGVGGVDADYCGQRDFLAKYPHTADTLVGSRACQAYVTDLCECAA